jgi:hypothetical protein
MKRSFKYDVAISAVPFDALAAAELKRRLEQRLRHRVLSTATPPGARRSSMTAAASRKAFEKDARVVVVLHQRLWGSAAAPATQPDAAAIRARIQKSGRKSVVVVPLDRSAAPSWLKTGERGKPTSPTGDQVVDQIVAAVVQAGGTPYSDTEDRLAARQATEERRARERTAFLTSQRAITMVTREFDALSMAVRKWCSEPGLLPDGFAPEERRTPDRYTVQIGPVGLSFSWIRGRSNSIADGQLLVIEWTGQLGDRAVEEGTKSAMPTFEHVLQPQATSPIDWQWRRADLDLCAYTTKDLAAQCITSVAQRLTLPSPSAGRATSKAGTLS